MSNKINIATITRFKIKNLTPHEVTILDDNNQIKMVIPKGKCFSRIVSDYEPKGNIDVDDGFSIYTIPLTKKKYKEVTNLPEEVGSEGYLIVSEQVKSKFPTRKDLVCPDNCILNTDGKVVGCKGLRL
jgi:hypothetical protein